MKKISLITFLILASWYLKAQTIEIGEEASVQIGVGASLTTGVITTSEVNNLIIKSDETGDGSLIAGGNPYATAERFVSFKLNHLITPLTTDVIANDLYDPNNAAWLSYHDEFTNSWTYITDLSDPLTVGQGYSYYVTQSRTVEFKGRLQNDDFSFTLKYSGDNDDQGWNLMGNPFSSALDHDNGVWDANSLTTGYVYVWDQNTTDGYRISSIPSSTPGTLPDNVIPKGQGFFVKATGRGEFVIPSSARVHDHSNAFYKSGKENKDTSIPFIRMDLDNGHLGNTVFVGFPENGSDDFDIPGDADKLFSSYDKIQFYTLENGKELCINTKKPLQENEAKIIPLYFVQGGDQEEHHLKFSSLDCLPEYDIVLEDLKTGYTQNVKENPEYTFEVTAEDDPHRLDLHFNRGANGLTEKGEQESGLNIYTQGNTLYVHSSEDLSNKQGKLFLYDFSGRIILERSLNKGILTSVSVENLKGYAVVKVVKGKIVETEKVIFQ